MSNFFFALRTNIIGGGGAAGMAARSGGDMAAAMAAAQAERARVKQLREEGKKPVGLPQKKGSK
jgi:hypothetical protein